jgi:hypothetical protein
MHEQIEFVPSLCLKEATRLLLEHYGVWQSFGKSYMALGRDMPVRGASSGRALWRPECWARNFELAFQGSRGASSPEEGGGGRGVRKGFVGMTGPAQQPPRNRSRKQPQTQFPGLPIKTPSRAVSWTFFFRFPCLLISCLATATSYRVRSIN